LPVNGELEDSCSRKRAPHSTQQSHIHLHVPRLRAIQHKCATATVAIATQTDPDEMLVDPLGKCLLLNGVSLICNTGTPTFSLTNKQTCTHTRARPGLRRQTTWLLPGVNDLAVRKCSLLSHRCSIGWNIRARRQLIYSLFSAPTLRYWPCGNGMATRTTKSLSTCVPVSEVPSRQHLRSARRHQLSVPRGRRGTFGTRAFSVAGPTVWNSLPDYLRDPAVDSEQFRWDLKTYLFTGHSRR